MSHKNELDLAAERMLNLAREKALSSRKRLIEAGMESLGRDFSELVAAFIRESLVKAGAYEIEMNQIAEHILIYNTFKARLSMSDGKKNLEMIDKSIGKIIKAKASVAGSNPGPINGAPSPSSIPPAATAPTEPTGA